MTWREVGDVAFYVAAGVTVSFALLYLLFAPWWKSVAGRNIMAVMGSVALAFAYFAWAIASKGIPKGFHEMRALLFMSIAAAIGWRTVIFMKHHIIPSLRTGKEPKDELEDTR